MIFGKQIGISLVVMLLSLVAFAETREVTGYGSGDDFGHALVAAKVDAILNAGGKTSVESVTQHEKLVRDGGASENEACLISYEVTEKGESFDGTYVRIKAKIAKDDSDYVLKDGNTQISGEGVASDPADAAVLAVCNAVMESGSRIKAVVKYENDELVEDVSSMDARGFVSSCEIGKGSDGEKITAKCKILKDEEALELSCPVEVSGEGAGTNVAFAEAVARRRMILKQGSEFAVHAAYKNGSQAAFTAERSRSVHIASVKTSLDNTGAGNPVARVSAVLSSSAIDSLPESSFGSGFGADVIAAHEAALCDAIVNRSSRVKVAVSYDKGHETDCSTEYSGLCNYFGEDVKSTFRADGGFVCEVVVKTVESLPDVAADIAQTVEAIGFGRNKSAAISDAKQRAVDMVFGSSASVKVNEHNGRVSNVSYQGTHSEKGYVDKCEVLSVDTDTGVTIVTVKAVVKNHDGDSAGWGWITITIVIIVLGVVFVGVKEKLGAVGLTIVWILATIGLFASGHWAVGITAAILGIGITKAD